MCVPLARWRRGPTAPARMAIATHRPEVRSATGRPGFTGGAAALAGEAHDAAHRLEDGVVALAVRVGAGLAEAGAGDVDDALVDGADRRIVEAVALERADREVLQKHVGLLREIAHDRLAVRRAQVDGDRLLGAVAGEVVGALGRAVFSTNGSKLRVSSPAPRLLDLDHGRAELGQDHAGERAGEHPRQVENGDVLEQLHVFGWRNARMRLLMSRPALERLRRTADRRPRRRAAWWPPSRRG